MFYWNASVLPLHLPNTSQTSRQSQLHVCVCVCVQPAKVNLTAPREQRACRQRLSITTQQWVYESVYVQPPKVNLNVERAFWTFWWYFKSGTVIFHFFQRLVCLREWQERWQWASKCLQARFKFKRWDVLSLNVAKLSLKTPKKWSHQFPYSPKTVPATCYKWRLQQRSAFHSQQCGQNVVQNAASWINEWSNITKADAFMSAAWGHRVVWVVWKWCESYAMAVTVTTSGHNWRRERDFGEKTKAVVSTAWNDVHPDPWQEHIFRRWWWPWKKCLRLVSATPEPWFWMVMSRSWSVQNIYVPRRMKPRDFADPLFSLLSLSLAAEWVVISKFPQALLAYCQDRDLGGQGSTKDTGLRSNARHPPTEHNWRPDLCICKLHVKPEYFHILLLFIWT